mmetsp:Transcript_16776/g.50263  ORF Transcript_16776/g.50263 Transcript_16776/m.50263 type:complete len:81 (-) Transcript_16776:959-1201(-)
MAVCKIALHRTRREATTWRSSTAARCCTTSKLVRSAAPRLRRGEQARVHARAAAQQQEESQARRPRVSFALKEEPSPALP